LDILAIWQGGMGFPFRRNQAGSRWARPHRTLLSATAAIFAEIF